MNNDQKVRALVSKVPGNLECADCGDSGKAVIKFCSVKLGVFLCNQCYAAHRALGAHITRGKCIGLDGFTDAEVDLLMRCGNARVNAQYEATMPEVGAKPPPTPCNGCSLSTCRDCNERLEFIANKYERKLWYSNVAIPAATQTTNYSTTAKSASTEDPFGLFNTSKTTKPSNHQPKLKPTGDTDFFASFGL